MCRQGSSGDVHREGRELASDLVHIGASGSGPETLYSPTTVNKEVTLLSSISLMVMSTLDPGMNVKQIESACPVRQEGSSVD
jgi:hypothetical protein